MVATPRHTDIVIPLFDHFEPLDAIGPYEILAYVPGATVRFVAAEPGLVQDVLGSLPVHIPTGYAEVEQCDVLLVPGGGSFKAMVDDADFLGWVRRTHAGTRSTTSVCTGSLVLGAAGLLDGLTATTHWDAAADLESYGAVYTPERVVRNDRVITSAGVSSGIDMAVRLAALLTDDVTAQAIQLYTEYDPQPPFATGSVTKAPPEVLERARTLSPPASPSPRRSPAPSRSPE
ncbi:DJ-1/PfpI family protein [Streptomyces lasiicapitis]|uniref:DJ-1/PfpI family protein n=1 Tax=Streptomyces lasiicapitis TaxID=1923961 RepID=UPI0036494127